MRLLLELREGPATSAALARRTAQTRGNVSYHLRSLARAGLIADEPDEGTERERWWRLLALPEVDAQALIGSEDVADAAEAITAERGRRLAQFAARLSAGEVPPARTTAARVSQLRFNISAERQAELVAELDAVLTRWEQADDDPGDDGEIVEVQLAVFSMGAR
jgi:DNA-binding MarR family transcriptional regulator